MSDFDKILALWRLATAADEDYVLASIVRVEGSSYRKPGARMLITQGGRRAGTISGGCLEAEVSKQAWWLTQAGPVLKAYSTSFEMDDDPDGPRPYGLGCGGTVHLLLERRATGDVFLRHAAAAFNTRAALACCVVLEGECIGRRSFVGDDAGDPSDVDAQLEVAARAWSARASITETINAGDGLARVWGEYLPARCGLFVFGAGDDAQPLAEQAGTLGWQITIADGRSHLATANRFPQADAVIVLKDYDLSRLFLRETDAVVLMTHSFEQDKNLLTYLLPRSLLYLGVLGPRYRTVELVKEAVEEIGGTPAEWMLKLHAPVGFDLGGDSPATIALSIVAEIQATLRQKAAPRLVQLRTG